MVDALVDLVDLAAQIFGIVIIIIAGDGIAAGVGDADDGVVEGRGHVDDALGDVLRLLRLVNLDLGLLGSGEFRENIALLFLLGSCFLSTLFGLGCLFTFGCGSCFFSGRSFGSSLRSGCCSGGFLGSLCFRGLVLDFFGLWLCGGLLDVDSKSYHLFEYSI